MPWLLRGDEVLAAVEIAATRRARRRGLIGRDGIEGALFLAPARSVHTVGMRFAIDVAFCARTGHGPSDEFVVMETKTMTPHRLGRPRRRATIVVEAEAGAFERWGLRPGDHLELR